MLVIAFILKNLDQYARRFWLSFIAGFINSCASIAIPLLLAEFTTSGLQSHEFPVLVASLVAAVVVSLMCSWYLRRYGEALAFTFANHLRLKYFRQLEQVNLGQLAKYHTGYVLSMVGQISDRMSPIFMDTFWWFSGFVVNIGLLIYFTATKSFGLTLLNLAVFLIFVVVSTILARKMTKLADARSRQSAVFSQYFVDFMSNIATIKRLGIRDFAHKRLTQRAQDTNEQIQIFQNAHSNRWLLLHSIYFTANFATIGYLLYEISAGAVPVSLLILFISFYGNLRGIIERVAENIITFTETRVYINNLEEILAGNAPVAASKPDHKHWKRIELHDVSYRHTDNAAVIQIPHMEIPRGDAVCIYGTSGEGKTTVLNIIANYISTESGDRTVDGVVYDKLERTWFADNSAFISQETELFNLSLRDNLVLGQTVSDARLWELLEDLQLAEWVRGLEHGLKTVVGEKGLRLSAGQKQRVNLARGILLDRSLYLLDEPTSHLDEETEKAVIAAIQKYLKGKTLVVVTHRPAIKKTCNQFYKMSEHTVRPE